MTPGSRIQGSPTPVVRLLDHVWRAYHKRLRCPNALPARRRGGSPAPYSQPSPQPSPTVMKSAMSILQVDRPACFGWAPSAPLASAALKVRVGFLSRKKYGLGGTVRGPKYGKTVSRRPNANLHHASPSVEPGATARANKYFSLAASAGCCRDLPVPPLARSRPRAALCPHSVAATDARADRAGAS